MTRDRWLAVVWASAIVTFTVVHDIVVLAVALLAALALAGGEAPRLARRTLGAVAVFNAVVTVSYVAMAVIQGRGTSWGRYVILMNLRVLLLTFTTLLFAARADVVRVFSFTPALGYLLTIARGQIVTFARLYDDARMALRSRTIGHLGWRERYRHGAASASFFARKALRESEEITLAMTSRGVFDDRG